MLTLIFSLVGLFCLVAFLGVAMAIYCYACLFPRLSKLTGNILLTMSLIFAALLIGSNRGGLYGLLANLFFGGGAVILGVWGAAFRMGSQATVKRAWQADDRDGHGVRRDNGAQHLKAPP